MDILKPKFDNDAICIAVSSSNEYVPYLSVYLKSIVDNASKKHNYDIIVFERDISDNNKKILQSAFKYENISLRFVNPTSYFKGTNLYVTHHYFKEECYYRIVAPVILNKFKKIIFTDLDIIVKDDIFKLTLIDMKQKTIAACIEPVWNDFYQNNQNILGYDIRQYTKNILKLRIPTAYYNTGVIIIDVEKYNLENSFNKIIELIRNERFLYQEQCALNKYFNNRITQLDKTWNFEVNLPTNIFYKKYKEIEDIKIIHYLGCGKPWLYLNSELAEIWWSYARQTPFYEEIMLRMIQHNTSMAMQISRNIDLSAVKNALNLGRNKLKYWRYKLLSKITFGKKRKKYKEKRKKVKTLIKQTKQFLKGIK